MNALDQLSDVVHEGVVAHGREPEAFRCLACDRVEEREVIVHPGCEIAPDGVRGKRTCLSRKRMIFQEKG